MLLRPDKTISTPQAMPWSLLPTLRTNQMAILHYHYIFPPTWYPQIQHQQQAELKSSPGQLDSEGPCVSNRGMAIVGRGEYVGAGDPFCQWHFCRLLYRLVQTHTRSITCVITGGSVLLWTVHRVHVGVAVSTSGSPWGPYTDPRGKFSLSFERSLMIVFPEKFHPQASLWWRSPSA